MWGEVMGYIDTKKEIVKLNKLKDDIKNMSKRNVHSILDKYGGYNNVMSHMNITNNTRHIIEKLDVMKDVARLVRIIVEFIAGIVYRVYFIVLQIVSAIFTVTMIMGYFVREVLYDNIIIVIILI